MRGKCVLKTVQKVKHFHVKIMVKQIFEKTAKAMKLENFTLTLCTEFELKVYRVPNIVNPSQVLSAYTPP